MRWDEGDATAGGRLWGLGPAGLAAQTLPDSYGSNHRSLGVSHANHRHYSWMSGFKNRISQPPSWNWWTTDVFLIVVFPSHPDLPSVQPCFGQLCVMLGHTASYVILVLYSLCNFCHHMAYHHTSLWLRFIRLLLSFLCDLMSYFLSFSKDSWLAHIMY